MIKVLVFLNIFEVLHLSHKYKGGLASNESNTLVT